MYCRQKENDGFYGRNESKQQGKRNQSSALSEDNICNISDIIASLDEDMAKRVLKLFVYDN